MRKISREIPLLRFGRNGAAEPYEFAAPSKATHIQTLNETVEFEMEAATKVRLDPTGFWWESPRHHQKLKRLRK